MPLIFEIDVYLRHMKLIRFISLSFAMINNFIYFSVLGIWIWEVYYPPDWFVYSPITVFGNLIMAYNILFDA